jgi:hypothetical protein
MKFNLDAYHVSGKSVEHTCVSGISVDPIENLPCEIEAPSSEAAEATARTLLAGHVRKWRGCACQNSRTYLSVVQSAAWWNSVSIAAYPAEEA